MTKKQKMKKQIIREVDLDSVNKRLTAYVRLQEGHIVNYDAQLLLLDMVFLAKLSGISLTDLMRSIVATWVGLDIEVNEEDDEDGHETGSIH